MTGLPIFDKTVQKSMKLIERVKEEANLEDTHVAFQGMRATLRALRDRLTVDEAVHIGAQLPNLITGYYYEGWKPSATPKKYRSKEEFLEQVRNYLEDVNPTLDAEHITQGVFRVLSEQISEGQVEDIISIFPKELRELWPREAVTQAERG